MAKKEVKDWKKEMAEQAKAEATNASGGGVGYISLKGGIMMYQEQQIPDNTLSCIVVANVAERTMYDRPYDPEDKDPPECFALGADPRSLLPHSNVHEPIHPTCKGCPKAEFGTARQGKGPACKTYRKLLVMPFSASMTAEDVEAADVAVLKVSPTSVANWNKYATRVAGTGVPTWGVVTDILVKPHPKKQFEISFSTPSPVIDADQVRAIAGRTAQGITELMRPYEYEEATNY